MQLGDQIINELRTFEVRLRDTLEGNRMSVSENIKTLVDYMQKGELPQTYAHLIASNLAKKSVEIKIQGFYFERKPCFILTLHDLSQMEQLSQDIE